jgi:serine protease
MSDWTYEGVAFYARVPDAAGNCAAGTASISRLFNGGQGGAPNHAYTADPAKRNALVAAGWMAEGTAFCTPLADADPLAQTQVLVGARWSLPSSTLIYGEDPIKTQFGNAISVGGQDGKFAQFGFAQPQVWIYHFVNDAFNGLAAWDPLSASYVAVENSGFEYLSDTGVAWTFDDAGGSSMPVCTMSVFFNLVSVDPYKQHPFQPNLWSACEPGVANRL